jgi:hypothetical protein
MQPEQRSCQPAGGDAKTSRRRSYDGASRGGCNGGTGNGDPQAHQTSNLDRE